MSGSLERFLIDRGETVVRLAPQLMAGARRGVRLRGKSDPIDLIANARRVARIEDAPDGAACRPRTRDQDARAVSRAALFIRTGYLAGCAGGCTTCGPTGSCPPRRCRCGWQTRRSRPGSRAEQTTQVLIARDMIHPLSESLSRAAKTCTTSSPRWSGRSRRSYLPNPGSVSSWPPSSSARSPASTGSPQTPSSRASPAAPRSQSPPDDQTATASTQAATANSTAPSTCSRSPASTTTPTPPSPRQAARNGKTKREAIRCLKRHLVRRVYHLLKDPSQVPTTICLTHGKSTKPSRIAENIDVFDFELLDRTSLAAIDRLDTGRRGGPEPEAITLETFGREIPEA